MKSATFLTLVCGIVVLPLAAGCYDSSKASDEGKAKPEHAQLPKCPVMGEPVNFLINTMTDEGPVYFCCKMCVGKYKEAPDKYAEKANEQRKALAQRERIQVTCPMSGEAIDKDVFAGEGKDRVYFCCKDCIEKYGADPAKYAAKLAASYTYQTHCPVMGGKIKPAASSVLPTGERIYYCCSGCDKKLVAEPRKYAKNLERQGIHIDVKGIENAARDSDED